MDIREGVRAVCGFALIIGAGCLVVLFALLFIIIGAAMPIATAVFARDNGLANTPAKERQWFQQLMQPDNPVMSCCGESDAYEADDYEVNGDQYIAIITDERSDTFPNGAFRPHIPPGTRIAIPNPKIKFDQSNPTGHGYVFIGSNGQLYCYCPTPGV